MSFHASYFWLSVLSGGRNALSPASAVATEAAEADHEGSLCCHVEVIAKDGEDDDGDDEDNSITLFVSGGDG